MQWFRGDCHVHSARSNGGELTPAQLASAARAFGLDFLAATEHNTCDTHLDWAAQADAGLLVILGQEVTTETGHWLALGLSSPDAIDWHYGAGDNVIGKHLALVRQSGGLCVAAHPHAPYPTGKLEYPHELFDVVEVWNGLWASDLPWNADNEQALADWARSLPDGVHSGQWLPAIGNSDTHLDGQIGIPHTVVLAPELSPEAILAALRAGHSWIAASPTINLTLTVTTAGPSTTDAGIVAAAGIAGTGVAAVDGTAGGRRRRSAGIGDTLRTNGEPVLVRVDVTGVPDGEVSVHTEHGVVHRETLPPNGSGTVRCGTGAGFVRVEVRHAGGHMAALTNPVILT